ncbi:tetratricopeptide repeat protein [Oligosphaera ethanolica]|uniref:Nephrocystin-3 n=1 Tax=Oligosphaera ethanolica TaxID=760260 RepID=A0AAE3VJ80_9BACT|nr:tetratricopeptide repeat protein [Oligosphaera ethanolica]MDQ0291572.1 nephrocystin-3 [Oligosphaera ethanolica]
MGLWEIIFGKKGDPASSSAQSKPSQASSAGGRPSSPAPAHPAPSLSSAAQADAQTDRRIRVFISSTFRDMMRERDEMMAYTWPQLRRLCQERQVEFVEVDLRWGVTEAQSTRKETLKLCLDEIRACRPYFIGILGERYGWTPPAAAFTPDLQEEQPWVGKLKGRSVTEMEILHGVLNNPKMAGRAFFYFRDPAYAHSRGADFLSETPADAQKQTDLKAVIRTACTAKNIPLLEPYATPKELASQVLTQLSAAINAQFPADQLPDSLAREANSHEAYAQSRRRTYIGRPEYYQRLDRHAAGDGGPLILLGESGSGKSALLANWLKHWRDAHKNDFVFQHYIGSTADSADHISLVRRLAQEIKRWTGDPDEIPAKPEELLRDFPLWLAKARAKAQKDGVRCILVLDALNQLQDKDQAHSLHWLPEHSFNGPLRLFTSTLSGAAQAAAEARRWEKLTVEPLNPTERDGMINHYLARYGKKLDDRHRRILIAAPQTANPLYLKIVLDELRITGTFEGLEARIREYLAAADIPALLGKVLARWQRDYNRDCPNLVGQTLGLIFAARRGLAESELLELLKPAGQPQLPQALWSPFRAAVDEFLISRDEVLTFAHDYLRLAVEQAFANDLDTLDALRLRLADYFEPLPPTRRTCDELPWLLDQTESFVRLRACLLNIGRFLLIREREGQQGTELSGYWVALKEERAMGQPYLQSFDAWAGGKGETTAVSYAANKLALFLHRAALHAEAEPLMRRALKIDEQSYGENHPSVAIDLNNLAMLLKATNRLAEAEPLMRRALKIAEQSYGENHPNVAASLNNLAQLLQATNRLAEAEPLMQRALKINETSYGENHPDVATSLNNLAQLLQATNRLAEAEPLMRRALKIDETSYGENHPDVARDLNNLAGLLHTTNRFAEAEPLMRRALKIDEQSYGENHPDVARDLNNLAQLLQATNRFAEAEPLYRRALKIAEQSYGENHPDVAIRHNNLALLLQATNRLAEAAPLMRRSVEIVLNFTRATGHPHPHLRGTLGNYANLLKAMGKPEDDIRGTLADLAGRYGVVIGGAGGQTGNAPSPKRLAVLEEIMRDQSKLQEIAARLQRDDPALFQKLLAFFKSQQNRKGLVERRRKS